MASPVEKFRPLAWPAACAGLVLFYLLTTPLRWQCEGVDEIEYLGLAHSLIRGFGYSLYAEPYGLYPPLFSAFLALLMKLGAGWRALYAVNGLVGAVGTVAAATWMRGRFGPAGVIAGWLALASYYAWSFSVRYLSSEPLFLLLSVGALVLADRMLVKNQAGFLRWLALGAVILAAAATRFGAVSLIAAIALAGGIWWLMSRRAVGLAVLLAAAVFGGGFLAAWQVRASRVAPASSELYSQWTKKALGFLKKDDTFVSRSAGEGTDRPMNWPERAAASGLKAGQYLASIPRPSSNFPPLALALFAAVVVGIVARLREAPASPTAWYVLLSLAMISLTSWISSYTRYLFLLSPFLFLFLVRGLREWGVGVVERRPGWVVAAGLVGFIGLAWTISIRGGDAEGFERVYQTVMWTLAAVIYFALAVAPFVVLKGREPLGLAPATASRLLAVALLAYAGHSGVIALARAKLVRADASLKERNLVGVADAGAWARQSSPADARFIVSVPRLFAFLADRPCAAPAYSADGTLDLRPGDRVLVLGDSIDVPQVKEVAELRLRLAAEEAAAGGELVEEFRSGSAAVYRRVDKAGTL